VIARAVETVDKETRTITEAILAVPVDTKYAYPPAITAEDKLEILFEAPVALVVRTSAPRRGKVVDARPPATSMRTRIDGLVAVPTMTRELVTSKTAQEGKFSPVLSVSVEPTFESVARLIFTILPGDVDVPT